MNIKIGSSWIFNTNTGEASKVIRNKEGKVVGFEGVFTLTMEDSNRYKVDSQEEVSIPLGVIRKGIEMLRLESCGKLSKYADS